MVKNSPVRARVGRSCVHAVMAALMIAAVLKLCDVTAFARSLEEWKLLPKGMIPLLGVSVPALELGIALAWFLGLFGRATVWMGFGLLLSFTGLYGAHVVMGEPPNCSCFGQFLEFKASVSESWKIMARNGALLALLGIGLALSRMPQAYEGRTA